jgi:hypothetical protein
MHCPLHYKAYRISTKHCRSPTSLPEPDTHLHIRPMTGMCVLVENNVVDFRVLYTSYWFFYNMVCINVGYVLFPPGHVWYRPPPSFLLAPGPRPIPTPFPIGPAKVSALADWFLFLKPFPRARLSHRPDDGGSKNLWNIGKLLPDYTALQLRRQAVFVLTAVRTSNPT